MMRHQSKITFRVLLAVSCLMATVVLAEYPKPSPYPVSWDLKFDYGTPKRVVVEVPGSPVGQAYWYIPYTVTNNTNKEQMFLPSFEMVAKDGQILRSDIGIPSRVFDAIKARERKRFLEPYPKITGELRVGEDQAKDGVAIWPEPSPRMGEFSIFIGGLSGEIATLKDLKGEPMKTPDGKPVILRKTLQLNFAIRGDEFYPGEDKVNENPKQWVMR